MSQEDIDATEAPLVEHLTELRQRLICAVVGLLIAAIGCFVFADKIFNILLWPYERATGDVAELQLIFTAPQEYLFTQFKIALFGGLFISFPVIASQLYKFVAPGLYKNERSAFLPFLIATPILFMMGACLVYFLIMPLAMTFFLATVSTPDGSWGVCGGRPDEGLAGCRGTGGTSGGNFVRRNHLHVRAGYRHGGEHSGRSRLGRWPAFPDS